MFTTIIAICNRELENVSATVLALTWFEEWVLFFEVMTSKSVHRWEDSAKEFGIGENYLKRVFDFKLMKVMAARNSWPKYLSFEEDHFFMKDEWKVRYKGS